MLMSNPRVQFVPVGYAPPSRTNEDMCADKVLKLSAASERAIRGGSKYIAFNDADDLVSNRIIPFVASRSADVGWFTRETMIYAYGSRFYRYEKISYPVSGPCIIVGNDAMEFATPPFLGAWVDLIRSSGEDRYLDLLASRSLPVSILAAVGHTHYLEYARSSGISLKPLPFPSNIVINHWDSVSHVAGGAGSQGLANSLSFLDVLRFLKRKGKQLRPMSRTLRREFSIPSQAEIPTQYRSKGSVLAR